MVKMDNVSAAQKVDVTEVIEKSPNNLNQSLY